MQQQKMCGNIILTSQDVMKMISLASLHYVGSFGGDCVKFFEILKEL